MLCVVPIDILFPKMIMPCLRKEPRIGSSNKKFFESRYDRMGIGPM